MFCATPRNIRVLAQTFAAAMVREKNFFPMSRKILVPDEDGEEVMKLSFQAAQGFHEAHIIVRTKIFRS